MLIQRQSWPDVNFPASGLVESTVSKGSAGRSDGAPNGNSLLGGGPWGVSIRSGGDGSSAYRHRLSNRYAAPFSIRWYNIPFIGLQKSGSLRASTEKVWLRLMQSCSSAMISLSTRAFSFSKVSNR